MTKSKTAALASVLAIALAVVPATSAFAWWRHGGGHLGGGSLFLGLGVAAAAIVTAPIVIAASVAQAAVYYPPAPVYPAYAYAPAYAYNYYSVPPPAYAYNYYSTPPPPPNYAPAYAYNYSAPPPPPNYAPAPAPSLAEWYFCPAANAYYPYVSDCPGGWQRIPAQPSR
jgi:hypothetical protein